MGLLKVREFNELFGIIEGINFDGIVNKKEVSRLKQWLDKNKNLIYDVKYTKIIKVLEDILEDDVVDEQEQKYLTKFVKEYYGDSIKEYGKIFELNGIIDGIICDDEINKEEVYSLNEWMNENDTFLENSAFGNELQTLLDNILEDKIVSAKEQEELLSMLKNHMNKSYFESKLTDLRKKVKAKENIGLDLIDILDSKEFVNEIHRRAEFVLQAGLNSHSFYCNKNQEILFISLSLIAMMYYDGSFYDGVKKIYQRTYEYYNPHKIEGFIRSMLNDHYIIGVRSHRERLITLILKNTIVPSHFLKHFFEFIYDIYKVNFNYSLPKDEELYSEFKFIYDGLKSKMLGESDFFQVDVTNKSYKLIKTTRQLILEENTVDSIINLSIIVIKLIDKKIWNEDKKILNDYLNQGFQAWQETLQPTKQKNRTSKRFYSRWKSVFELRNNNIYIVPPIHKIKENYDYRSIYILIQNGEKVIYENKSPNIRAIFGGYEINESPIKINNPLGQLRYKVISNSEVIYDSQDSLYRDFIIFNSEKNEINNNTNYTGNVILCSKIEHSEFKKYNNQENYILSTKNVHTGDVFLIDGKIFNFSEITKPGLLGKRQTNCVIKEESDQLIPVFRTVKALMFECDEKYSIFRIVINHKTCMIKDTHLNIKYRLGIKQCVYNLEINQPGIYSIKVYAIEHNHEKNILNKKFAIDNKLFFESKKINDSEYCLNIHSDIMGFIYKHIHNYEEFEALCQFILCNKKYTYYLPVNFSVYKLDNYSWNPFKEEIWIGDIHQGSRLYIADKSINRILVKAYNGSAISNTLDVIDLKKLNNVVFSQMDFLNNYKSHNKVALLLFSNEELKGIIDCYNRCTVDEKDVQINYDSENNILNIKASYHGRGKIYYEIKNQNNEIEYKSDYLISGQIDSSIAIKSLKEYKITFYEKLPGLSLKKNHSLLELRRHFFVTDNLIGHEFELISAKYEKFIKKRNRWLKNNCDLKNTYIKFLKKNSNLSFMGEIYTKTSDTDHYFTQINPVEIEICTDAIDNTIELLITNEGDGLYLDQKNHTILDSLYDRNAIDILLYIMSLKEVD